MASRTNYWSCSRFAKKIRSMFGAIPKPSYATGQEWSDWNKRSKSSNPIIHWIAEEGLDKVQDFIYWPLDKYEDIEVYIRNRYIDKLQYLDTGLKPGEYYDLNHRILHGLFNEFVKFIDNDAGGIEYVTKRCEDKYNENCGVYPEDPTYGQPSCWAEDAQTQKKLYDWWKNVRPNRPDPYDVSGWSKHCAETRDDFLSLLCESKSEEENRATQAKLEALRKLEADYDKEDEEMLIQLIKIRQGLWD